MPGLFPPLDLAAYIQDASHDELESSTAEDDEQLDSRDPSHSDSDSPVFIGAKLEWESDEGVPVKTKKSNKKKATKKSLAKTKNQKTPKQLSTATATIRRSRMIRRSRQEPDLSHTEESEVGSDDDTPDQALPHYLRMRLAKLKTGPRFDQNQPIRIPPRYEHQNLRDHGKLSFRPAFKDSTPRNPDEDIELHSRGMIPKQTNITTPISIGIIPAPIAKWLRKYQIEGAHFLLDRFAWQQGGILADDMGLGKTIQVIAFLTAAFGKTADSRDLSRRASFKASNPSKWYPRVLIVCPGSLMDNWTSELNAWGFWQVDRLHGASEQKQSILSAAKSGSVEIVITTYTTYKLNQNQINLVEWDCVIADECHAIKSRSSQITQAMNDVNALCRIGLTGTAIQNDYNELWTLLNWANPGSVSTSRSWKELISGPLRRGQTHDATTYDHGVGRRTAIALKNELLPRFFLRRWKSLIADQLPQKSDRVIFCPLSELQKDAYKTFLASPIGRCIYRSTDPCYCGKDKTVGTCCGAFIDRDEDKPLKRYMFPALQALKNMANHLGLLIPDGSKLHEEGNTGKEILQSAVPDLWEGMLEQKDSIEHLNKISYCGKFKVLLDLLQWWYNNGDKVLIFSHSVKLLTGLNLLLAGYSCSYLDGSMPYNERTEAVNKFNSDKDQFIFLLSVRAGGVGLNITSANKVVILDPSWNPAHDLQAQDRAYRIGQLRNVEVFRLVSIGTIEEIVYARQIYKQQQANIGYNASLERRYFSGVQGDTKKRGELFGLKNLFTFHEDQVVLQGIVNKTNIAESKASSKIKILDVDLASQELDTIGGDITNQKGGVDPAVKALADDMLRQSTSLKSKKGTKAQHGAAGIDHILAQAGVQYFHENSEVIGTSKVESKLSRRAMEKTTEEDMDQEVMFKQSQFQDLEHPLKYRPDEAVRVRQFCSMAKYADMSTTDFARVVERWTQGDRRDFLDKFYAMRATKLENQDGHA